MSEAPAVRALTTIFALTYPLAAHMAVEHRSVAWVIAAICVLSAAVLTPGLLRGRLGAWLSVPIVAAGCWLVTRAAVPELPLYVIPVLAFMFMGWVFGHTLLSGRTPLIAQLIELMHRPGDEPPEPAVWAYARALTFGWTLLFATLASINLLLALIADPNGLLFAAGFHPPFTVPLRWWSLFANGIDYALVAAFFAIEYAYRRFRFPQQPFKNMVDFLRQMSAAMPRLLHRMLP